MGKDEIKELVKQYFSKIITGWTPPSDFDVNQAEEQLEELAEKLSA